MSRRARSEKVPPLFSFASCPAIVLKTTGVSSNPAASSEGKTFFSRKTSLLLWIDRFAGVPICFFLTLARRLGDLFTGGGSGPPPRSILFLKLAEQGSTVLAHEALRQAV